MRWRSLAVIAFLLSLAGAARASSPDRKNSHLRSLIPAFDHLGNVGDQAETAAASGCTLIYATGIGKYSYSGLPHRTEMEAYLADRRAYNNRARRAGAKVILSYLCATSIVNIDRFAANWDEFFPNRPGSFDPRRMLQLDIRGNPLPSWYGGDYSPADMWNPHWRQYTKLCIRLAVESGHDGVFFDNPTVHTKGNYSPCAMKAWAGYLERNKVGVPSRDLPSLRAVTIDRPELWRRFRITEAADFLKDMRAYGKSLNPRFVLTANNSLNSWGSFYSQPRGYGYSIPEQSNNEDLVTIEDMSSQPRKQGDKNVSYGGTLRMIRAIGEGKPLSICTTDGDYVASPNLLQVSIAECAAHGAAYMVWSCWAPEFREKQAAAAWRYHDFIAQHRDIFDGARPVADVAVIWPYENWQKRDDCPTARLAQELTAKNIQFDVITENQINEARLKGYKTVVMVAEEDFCRPESGPLFERLSKQGRATRIRTSSDQVERNEPPTIDVRSFVSAVPPSVTVDGSTGIRAVIRRTKSGSFILHVYNLNVTRQDSYHDEAIPVENMRLKWRLPPAAKGKRIELFSPDWNSPLKENAQFKVTSTGVEVEFVIPKLNIWTIAVLKN